MSASQMDIRGLQSKTDESILETLKENLRQVKAAFDLEKTAFEAARARFERAAAALASAQNRFDGYAAIVSEQRNKICRIPELETEILCSIFEAACPPHTIDAWSMGTPTTVSSVKERSVTPFRLSAVCRRWRSVATTSGSMWNLIAIPDDSDDSARTSRIIDYITTVSQRSKLFDLTVIIDWQEVEDVDERDSCARIIATLAPLLQRVVSFEIHVGCCGTWMNLFRRPTPRMKTLFCMVSQPSDAWNDARLPRYLPVAPKLECLRLDHAPLVPQSSLPTLRRLALEWARVPSDIITTVFANAPALVTAQLTFTSVDVVDAPASARQLTAPALTYLHLLSAAAHVLSQPNITWQFPRITRMTIDIMQIDTAHQIFDTVSSTLIGLTLDGPGTIRESIAEVLRPLAKLRALTIRSCVVADEFWRSLCQADMIVLPALNSVTLDAVDLAEDDEGNIEHGDGLVQFVSDRRRRDSTAVAAGTTGLKTVGLVTIKRHGTLDTWLIDEINYIMSSST